MEKDQVLLNDWHVIARAQELKPGAVLPKRLLGEDIVVWHDGTSIHAWQDYCPHRGAKLSLGWVNNNTLICPYHGLVFNTEGKCIKVPGTPETTAPTRLCIKTYQVKERYSLVWVCLGTPQHDIPDLPEWDDADYSKFVCNPQWFKTSSLRVIENFFDPAHVAFVHSGTFSNPNLPEVELGEAIEHPDKLIFKFGLWELDIETGKSELSKTFSNYELHIFRPLLAYYKRGNPEVNMTSLFPVTPVSEQECIAWSVTALKAVHDVTYEQWCAIDTKIMSEDRTIIESQRPSRLPLDLQAEVNLPTDRYSIVYRKWLKKQGVTFGCI